MYMGTHSYVYQDTFICIRILVVYEAFFSLSLQLRIPLRKKSGKLDRQVARTILGLLPMLIMILNDGIFIVRL